MLLFFMALRDLMALLLVFIIALLFMYIFKLAVEGCFEDYQLEQEVAEPDEGIFSLSIHSELLDNADDEIEIGRAHV